MQNSLRGKGLIVSCDISGTIQNVIRNGYGPDLPLAVGAPLDSIFETACREKVLFFLSEARTNGSVIDWELVILLNSGLAVLHCAAVLRDNMLTVIGSSFRDSVHQIMEEILRINNEQSNQMSSMMKEMQITSRHSEYDNSIYNELTRLNNQLSNMQREQLKKNAELERLNGALKSAQAQMLQREKMASIGLLAAGIAHEINNPIGFILSNLNSLNKYGCRIMEYVTAQSTAMESVLQGEERCDDVISNLAKTRRRLKIDTIISDFFNVINESTEGAERVKKIVQNLKNFSHLDGSQWKLSDINAGLESTINIIWNELKYKADVVKEFGELPETLCNPGELNQVFMNILINATHAIETHGEIRITTGIADGFITIKISDNGGGISPEHITRIFEPFFTTKEVGKGTGLGLGIAYDIVKKHNGEIDVESKTGRGTTFTVKIPVRSG